MAADRRPHSSASSQPSDESGLIADAADDPVAAAESLVSAAWLAALHNELSRRQATAAVLEHMREAAASAVRRAQVSAEPAAIVVAHEELETAVNAVAAARTAAYAAHVLLTRELAARWP
jgi:hypothetical protein